MRVPSPLAVSHFPHNPQDSVVWQVSKLPEELTKKRWAEANGLHEIGRDLSCQGKQYVRVLAEGEGQGNDAWLRGRGFEPSLDFAEIGRLHTNALSQLAYREGRILSLPGFPAPTKVVAKCAHMCSMSYTLPMSIPDEVFRYGSPFICPTDCIHQWPKSFFNRSHRIWLTKGPRLVANARHRLPPRA